MYSQGKRTVAVMHRRTDKRAVAMERTAEWKTPMDVLEDIPLISRQKPAKKCKRTWYVDDAKRENMIPPLNQSTTVAFND